MLMFQGSIVALVTPMHPDGSIDKKTLSHLIEWHIESKTDGIVVVGTTGECATLTMDEQYDVISHVVNQVNHRIPVIAGTGSYCTQHTIELTEQAKKAGADAALIVTPYYNKPPQQGLYEHYKMIAEKVSLPIILYNVPGRTACDLLPETVHRLATIPNIIGIKEATGKRERTIEILKQVKKEFAVYSGDDASNLDLMLHGATGVISVTANVAPLQLHDFCEAILSKNTSLAEKIHSTLMPLHQNLFLEANPIPVKWALHKMGLIPAGIRLPLVPLDNKYHATLLEAMKASGVMK